MGTQIRGHTVPRGLLVGSLIVLLVCVATVALAKPGNKSPTPESKTFEISGTVGGLLYPTVEQVLPVKIENPFNKNIGVSSVTITVGDALPTCAAANVAVGEVPVPVFIESGEDLVVDVPIIMASDAANECQGAVFPITYEGVATKR